MMAPTWYKVKAVSEYGDETDLYFQIDHDHFLDAVQTRKPIEWEDEEK